MVNVEVSEETHSILKDKKEEWDLKSLDSVIRLLNEKYQNLKRFEVNTDEKLIKKKLKKFKNFGINIREARLLSNNHLLIWKKNGNK